MNEINVVVCTISFVLILIIVVISCSLCNKNNKNNKTVLIPNKLVKQQFNSLVNILGKPNYMESDYQNKMKSATWMSPLDNFNDFGKYGGADYIKIHGNPSKKYHPHPANVFLIVGKYINVPEHLFGPIKYSSETINIEQLFVPKKYSDKYYSTGMKDVALVTGSCASVTISAITVQFVMDMIEKYRNINKSLELYTIFRDEYDRRINNYLCGKGITETIPWFDNKFFGESDTAFLGNKECGVKNTNVIEDFSHYEGCKDLMANENYCKNNPENKCC